MSRIANVLNELASERLHMGGLLSKADHKKFSTAVDKKNYEKLKKLLELQVRGAKPTKATRPAPKAGTYAHFVKTNFQKVKKKHPEYSAPDIIRIIAADWQLQKPKVAKKKGKGYSGAKDLTNEMLMDYFDY
jgi:hypothetical protein